MKNNFKVINPSNLQTIQSFEADNLESVQSKFELLKNAQMKYLYLNFNQRLEWIINFKNNLMIEKDLLAQDLSLEVGKPLHEAQGEVIGAANKLDFFIKHAQDILSDKIVNLKQHFDEVLQYMPLGVVGQISAWNYPYLVGINIFIPALLAGNAIFYKPSEYSTLTGLHIQRLFYQSGVPESLFQILLGDGKVGELMTDLPIDALFFTGSYPTGRKIHQKMGGRLIPIGMELGGKDALYLTDEVSTKNLPQAIDSIFWGLFYNNGQSCCSVERLYIHEKIYDQAIQLLIQKMSTIRVGDPMNTNTHLGAITRKEQIPFLQGLLDDALKKGARIIAQAESIPEQGFYFKPTLLDNCHHEMRMMQEETFGPLKGIMKVSSDNEAILLMNDSSYGLTASVYSDNIIRAKNILKHIEVGTTYINCCDRVSSYLPWTGLKNSGLGSTLSQHGIFAFTHPVGMHINYKIS